MGHEHYVVLTFKESPPPMLEIALSLKESTSNASLTSRGPKEKTVGFSTFQEKMDFLKRKIHVVCGKSADLSDPTPELTKSALEGQHDANYRDHTRIRIYRIFSANTRLNEEEVHNLISKDFPSRNITQLRLDKFYDEKTKTQTNIRNGHVTFWLQGPITKLPDCHKDLGRYAVYQEKGPFTPETKTKSKERSQSMMARRTASTPSNPSSSGSTFKNPHPSNQGQPKLKSSNIQENETKLDPPPNETHNAPILNLQDPSSSLNSIQEKTQSSSNSPSNLEEDKKEDTAPESVMISNPPSQMNQPPKETDKDPKVSPATTSNDGTMNVDPSLTPQNNKRSYAAVAKTPSPKDRKESRHLEPSEDEPDRDEEDPISEDEEELKTKNEARGKQKIKDKSCSDLSGQTN